MISCKILFKYSSIAATEISIYEDSGFSFALFHNGIARYEEYIGFKHLSKLLNFKVDKSLINKIKLIIKNNKEIIRSLDKDIDNGSDDGQNDVFQFYTKRISCYNIDYHNINAVKKNNPKYYQEYYNVMVQENQLMKIFDQIRSVLKEYHINLKFSGVNLPLSAYTIHKIKCVNHRFKPES